MNPSTSPPWVGIRRLLLITSSLTVISASAADFRYYRFTPTHLRDDATSNSIQISEFGFLDSGAEIDLSGVTVTNPGGRNPAAETAPKIIDGLTNTKWLDFNKAPLVFDFGTTTTVSGYFFATPNDAADRDPLRWKMEGSTDGTTWVLLDNLIADAPVPADRQTFTGDFLLPASPPSTDFVWTGGVSSDWNTTEPNWINGSATSWLNGTYALARFPDGAPSTVQVTEAIDARVLEFTGSGYGLNGGTISLSGVNRIDAIQDAEIASTLGGTAGMTKTGPGKLLLTGESSYSGTTSVRGGTLAYDGAAVRTVVGNLEIGMPGESAILEQSGTSNIVFGGNPGLGNGDNSTGIIRQSGGTSTYASNIGYLTIGNGTGAFGAVELSGGTMTTGAASGIRVGGAGSGSFVQTGGELTSNRWFAVGNTNAIGTVSLLGGNTTVTPDWRLIIGDKDGATATVNIGTMKGGDATLTTLRTSTADGSIVMASGTSVGYLNLNSGTIEAHGAIYSSGAAYFNANGGTLRAGTDGVELCKPTLPVNAYKGGLHVDTNGFNALISSPILQPFGPGVYLTDGTLDVPNGGSGYLAAPLVQITSDSLLGFDATAVAEVEDGVVTAIIMTNPGNGYEVGDTLTFSFIGGGPDTPATDVVHLITAADLDDGMGGGLVKTGAGTLTLTANSDYQGATVVQEGTLAVNGTLDTTPITVASGATLSGNLDTQGPVTVDGTFAPGDGVGTAIGAESLTLNAGSTFDMQVTDWIGTAGTGYDTASFGSLAITATSGSKLTIEVDGTGITNFSETGASFVLASADSAPAGLTGDNWQVTTSNFPGTGTWSLDVSGNDLVLNYTAGVGGYSAWIAGFAGLSDATAEGDPDKDGLANVLEYVLNGNPALGSPDVLPTAVVETDEFVFTFVRRSESKNDTTQTFEYGTDLENWTQVAIPSATGGQVSILPDTPSTGLETVTVSIPRTEAEEGKLFGRLAATRP